MDFSQVNDPDHPDGASPWQTSPAPNRTSFPADPDSVPSSPAVVRQSPPTPEPKTPNVEAPAQPQSPTEEPGEPGEPETPDSEEPPSPEQNGSRNQSQRQISQSTPDIRFQGPPMTEEELRQEQLRQQRIRERHQQQLNAQQHQRTPGRYHGKQGQKQPPAYKLQARITALERTGKKDPAIHFDVHVGCFYRFGRTMLMLALD